MLQFCLFSRQHQAGLNPERVCSLLASFCASPLVGVQGQKLNPKSIKSALLTGVRLVAIDLSISTSPTSPCRAQRPAPGKPAPKEHCCSCNGLGRRTASLTGVSFSLPNTKRHAIFFCTSSNLTHQADYKKNRTGEHKASGLREIHEAHLVCNTLPRLCSTSSSSLLCTQRAPRRLHIP